MNRREFLTASAALVPLHAAGTKKPNIVVILADDFGYGSLNCYGAETKPEGRDVASRLADLFSTSKAKGHTR